MYPWWTAPCFWRPYVSQMVESRSIVSGAAPGPAPAAQARASSSRLTRSSWRTWPRPKLRRNVPTVDAALTVKPRTRSVSPARSASTSSMRSPPASADMTRVRSLSPTLRPARRPPQVEVLVDELPETQVVGQGGRQEEPRVGHQAVIVEGRLEPVEAVG